MLQSLVLFFEFHLLVLKLESIVYLLNLLYDESIFIYSYIFMLHINTVFSSGKSYSSKIVAPHSSTVQGSNTKKVSVLSAPKTSKETRPKMPTHDAYLKGHETRKEKWAELAETPSLAEIKKFINLIRADFTPEQQEQLKKILAIGRTGYSEDKAFKEIRRTVTSNDIYQLFKKHLIEIAQNLTIIGEKVLEEQPDSSAREAFIKGINPLIQEAKLFALLDLGIINKITARYTRNDDSRLEQDDFRHAAIERLLTSKDESGFLGHVDITSIDPNTGKPYIGTPLVDFYIKAGAIRELQNNDRTIRLPVHTHEKLNKLRKLAEAYSKLPDNETKPKFEEYYAQQTGVSIEQESSTLQELKMFGANILLLDKPRTVTYLDSYGERDQVDVALSELTAQSEELSPEDIIDLSLLGADLKEVLGTLSQREGDVLSLRYGLVDGQLKSLEELGRHFGVTRERIRQIEAKALRKLRHPNRNSILKGYIRETLPITEAIAIRREEYLTQQAQDETIISETKQKNLHNETNVEASKKVLENYEALLKAQMQELLPDQNVLEELLKCEDPASEVQAYSKTRTFKNRGEYEGFIKEFISLLTDYRQSKTREGKYEVLKGILNINNKEQSKLLLADIGLNKETGAGFMEYLRNLSLNPPEIITKELEIVLEIGSIAGQVTEEVPDLVSSISYNFIKTVLKSISTNFKVDNIESPRLMFEALDRLIKQNEGSFDGLINFLYNVGPGNSAKQFKAYIDNNPNITFCEIFEKVSRNDSTWKLHNLDPSISQNTRLSGAISLNGKAILHEIEKMLSEETTSSSLTPVEPPRVLESQTGLAINSRSKIIMPNTSFNGSKADYDTISNLFRRIIMKMKRNSYKFDSDNERVTKLMFEVLDGLIAKNEGSVEGLVHFLDSNASTALKEYITQNPNISFLEMYNKVKDHDLRLSILDQSISNNLHLNGAIKLNTSKIVSGVLEKILSEETTTKMTAVKETKPITEILVSTKLNYKNILNMAKSFIDKNNGKELGDAGLLILGALDRLIAKNNGSLDGIAYFLKGKASENLKRYITENPNITFTEMYQKSNSSLETFSLSNLDPAISKYLYFSNAIELHEDKIFIEIEKILSEETTTASLVASEPQAVSQTKINEEDKKLIFQAIKLYQITIKRELTSLGVTETTIPELLKCNNQTEIQSYLVNLDDFAQKSIPQKLQICKSRVKGALEFLKLPDNVIQDLLKCGSELELQTYLQNI